MKYYTFYLLNGQRKVFLGVNEQDAYLNNQSYKDGQQAIMLIDEGITDNYYWNNGSWIKKEVLQIPNVIVAELGEASIRNINPEVFYKHNEVIYIFENKDQLVLSRKWGHFFFGWTLHFEITYAQYQEGPYCDEDTENDCHYLCHGSQYFSPNDKDKAIEIFLNRLNSSKPYAFLETNDSMSLDTIHDQQAPSIIYSELNKSQKLVLLGSLIKRLDNNDDIKNFIKDGFIIKPDSQKQQLLCEIYEHIMYYCDECLITSSGQRNLDFEEFLEKHYGFKFSVGEKDRFGVLTMVIKLNNGKLVYG